MSYNVRPKELIKVSSLTPQERYSYFIGKVADWQEVWGIRDDAGWVCPFDSTEAMCFPVWPAKAFAEECCVDDWQSRHPESISLGDWMKKWLPGMQRDGMAIMVFPVPPIQEGLSSTVVKPDRLSADLQEAISQFVDEDGE